MALNNYPIIPGQKTNNNALVMTDVGGDKRGDNAIDIQSSHISSRVAAGTNSICLGVDNLAKSEGSISIGVNNISTGNYSLVIGAGNTCSGVYSLVCGNFNSTSNDVAIAYGHGNIINGIQSSCFGVSNTASGSYSVSIGRTNSTDFSSAVAIGLGNISASAYSAAIGVSNTSTGPQLAASIGLANSAAGVYSAAFGGRNKTAADTQQKFGYYNFGSSTSISSIGIGIGNNSQQVSVDKNTGVVTVGTPVAASSVGIRSVAVGINNNPSSNNCSVFGQDISGNISGCCMIGPNNNSRMVISGSGTVIMSGMALATTTETLNYNAKASDSLIIMDINTSRTLQLPNAIGNKGRVYIVKNIGTSTRTVTVSSVIGGQTIDGAASDVISGNYLVRTYISDNSNWFTI